MIFKHILPSLSSSLCRSMLESVYGFWELVLFFHSWVPWMALRLAGVGHMSSPSEPSLAPGTAVTTEEEAVNKLTLQLFF